MPFAQDAAKSPQLLDILMVNGQFMDGRVFVCTLGKGPSLQRLRASMQYFVNVRPGQIGSEGHIEGQVDYGIIQCHGRNWLAIGRRPLDGLRDGHVHLVWPRRHEAGGGHLLEAMTSLAGDIAGEPLHLQARRPRLDHFPYWCRRLGVKVGKGASGWWR